VLCRTLNRIQSRIYPTAFGSNENVLVSAPTGAGKTNIAMIAVLREVGNNMAGGMIDKVRLARDNWRHGHLQPAKRAVSHSPSRA